MPRRKVHDVQELYRREKVEVGSVGDKANAILAEIGCSGVSFPDKLSSRDKLRVMERSYEAGLYDSP